MTILEAINAGQAKLVLSTWGEYPAIEVWVRRSDSASAKTQVWRVHNGDWAAASAYVLAQPVEVVG